MWMIQVSIIPVAHTVVCLPLFILQGEISSATEQLV